MRWAARRRPAAASPGGAGGVVEDDVQRGAVQANLHAVGGGGVVGRHGFSAGVLTWSRDRAAGALCCAHVLRAGLRPTLPLYFAPQNAPPTRLPAPRRGN